MNLFQRISDILSANLHDWAEQFAQPELMLRQAVREMEAVIDHATQQTAKSLASETLLAKELARNRAQRDQWMKRAKVSMAAGDDERSRGAITRKNGYHAIVRALDDQLQASRDSSQALQRQLVAMKSKLSEAQRNLATLVARQRAVDFRKKLDQQAHEAGSSRQDHAFAKFDRLQQKVECAEAEAAALAELRGGELIPASASRRSLPR
ncbi:MAG TPA: PspA/IM30 family protein [Pirellulaceae bacterium]|nr:PspA/IM30 family protein [Pirellulaceae bacterium]